MAFHDHLSLFCLAWFSKYGYYNVCVGRVIFVFFIVFITQSKKKMYIKDMIWKNSVEFHDRLSLLCLAWFSRYRDDNVRLKGNVCVVYSFYYPPPRKMCTYTNNYDKDKTNVALHLSLLCLACLCSLFWRCICVKIIIKNIK